MHIAFGFVVSKVGVVAGYGVGKQDCLEENGLLLLRRVLCSVSSFYR